MIWKIVGIVWVVVGMVAGQLSDILQWKQISYDNLPAPSGNLIVSPYVAKNNIPFGISFHENSQRLFVTVPRLGPGVPSTINYVNTDPISGNSPALRPYPDYTRNTPVMPVPAANDERIVSVYKSVVDECSRLIFIDTGILEYGTNVEFVQKPALWIYDLTTDSKLVRFEINTGYFGRADGFGSLTVDGPCDDSHVYIPNKADHGVYVYSVKQNKAWTLRHNSFALDPMNSLLNYSSSVYETSDGISSIALGPVDTNQKRTTFYSAFGSISQYGLPTDVLKNANLAAPNYIGNHIKYQGDRPSGYQSNCQVIEPLTGVMMYTLPTRNAIGCWNINKNMMEQGIVFQDNDKFTYPWDIKLLPGATTWVLTNNAFDFYNMELNLNEVNFRVWKGQSTDIAKGSPCFEPLKC